jgi:hypothetical protein
MLSLTIAGYRRGQMVRINQEEFDQLRAEVAKTKHRAFHFSHFCQGLVDEVIYPLHANYGIDILILEDNQLESITELAEFLNVAIVILEKQNEIESDLNWLIWSKSIITVK